MNVQNLNDTPISVFNLKVVANLSRSNTETKAPVIDVSSSPEHCRYDSATWILYGFVVAGTLEGLQVDGNGEWWSAVDQTWHGPGTRTSVPEHKMSLFRSASDPINGCFCTSIVIERRWIFYAVCHSLGMLIGIARKQRVRGDRTRWGISTVDRVAPLQLMAIQLASIIQELLYISYITAIVV